MYVRSKSRRCSTPATAVSCEISHPLYWTALQQDSVVIRNKAFGNKPGNPTRYLIQRWLAQLCFAYYQKLYSLSDKVSYRYSPLSLEASKLCIGINVPLWNLTGTWVAMMPILRQTVSIIHMNLHITLQDHTSYEHHMDHMWTRAYSHIVQGKFTCIIWAIPMKFIWSSYELLIKLLWNIKHVFIWITQEFPFYFVWNW